jgi:hypothetical protein
MARWVSRVRSGEPPTLGRFQAPQAPPCNKVTPAPHPERGPWGGIRAGAEITVRQASRAPIAAITLSRHITLGNAALSGVRRRHRFRGSLIRNIDASIFTPHGGNAALCSGVRAWACLIRCCPHSSISLATKDSASSTRAVMVAWKWPSSPPVTTIGHNLSTHQFHPDAQRGGNGSAKATSLMMRRRPRVNQDNRPRLKFFG